jgi:hypothetical protein
MMVLPLGVYGVPRLAVGQRTGEIGIRMAVGAEGRSIPRMVLVAIAGRSCSASAPFVPAGLALVDALHE